MDDSIPSGESKLPLYVSGIAIAAAVLSLIIAFKARGETNKTLKDFDTYKSTIEQTQSELSSKIASAAKLADVDAVRNELDSFKKDTTAFSNDVRNGFAERDKVLKTLASGHTARPAPGNTAPVVAGPGEYIVKSGDNFYKIAKANGVSVKALETVNPGVKSSNLKPGQKLKLPAKQ